MRTVPRSLTWSTFEADVAAHAFELKQWRDHMARVASDETGGVAGIARHWPLQRPTAHGLVEASVNEAGIAEYKIIEDGPAPEDILKEKKESLRHKIAFAEQVAIENIVPFGKRRLFNIRENDIRKSDSETLAKISAERQSGIVAAVASMFKNKTMDIDAAVAAARSPEDTQHLEEQHDRRRRIEAIERIAAHAQHDIEDLTLDTVDSWKPPAFPS